MNNILPISVVIPTMNRPKTFGRTVDCLMSQDSVPAQIIVVDQSQSAEHQNQNKACLEKYKDQIRVDYVYQAAPSLTVARNNGASYCLHDIIICSDDDVDVNPDTIQNVYDLMSDNSIAMIAGLGEHDENVQSKLGYLFGTKSYQNRHTGHVTLSMLGRYPDRVIGEVDTMWAMGYFFAIRKSLAGKWNVRWDENLTSYGYAEDLDFSFSYYKHAKAEDLRCILSDKVKVRHLVSTEYRVPTDKNIYMYVLNREYLSYKHHMGLNGLVATRWTNFGLLLFHLLRREKPMTMLKAQLRCDKLRKNLRKGMVRPQDYL